MKSALAAGYSKQVESAVVEDLSLMLHTSQCSITVHSLFGGLTIEFFFEGDMLGGTAVEAAVMAGNFTQTATTYAVLSQ